jgi:SAM-dependent methyltransferase
MSKNFASPLSAAESETSVHDFCDLCGASERYVFKQQSSLRCRTVICSVCGLIYADPHLSPAALDFFNLNNPGDPGSQVNAPSGSRAEQEIQLEESRAAKLISLMQHFMDLKGKKVLGLRCRSGALTALLRRQGADELGLDPQQPSIDYAQRVRGLTGVRLVPMSDFDKLDFLADSGFDAVEGLTEHVAAHVISVRQFMTRIFQLLKPGGYLFLDEKDLFSPTRKFRSVLDTGQAHQYHFTVPTFTGMIQSIGFELVESTPNKHRVTDFRHFIAVARKPLSRSEPGESKQFIYNGPDGKEVRRQLRKLELDCWLTQCYARVGPRTLGLLRHVPGVRKAWRLTERIVKH